MRYYEFVKIADPNQNICVYDACKDAFHFGTPKSLSDSNTVDSNARVISLSVGFQDKWNEVVKRKIPIMQVEVDSI